MVFHFGSSCANCNFTNTSFVADRLPVLTSHGKHPAWDRYLQAVFGDATPDSIFPLDLNTFSWFYHRKLPIEVQPATLATTCKGRTGHAFRGNAECGYSGHGMPESQPPLRSAGFFVQRYDSQKPKPRQMVPNNTWVEVMRTAMNRRTTESPGSWYWVVRGSGVWLNVGRTYVADTSPGSSPERFWFFENHLRGLAKAGFDTLQIPRLVDTLTFPGIDTVGNDRFELVVLNSPPSRPRGSCAGHPLRAGWFHDRNCHCVEKVGIVNCNATARDVIRARERN